MKEGVLARNRGPLKSIMTLTALVIMTVRTVHAVSAKDAIYAAQEAGLWDVRGLSA